MMKNRSYLAEKRGHIIGIPLLVLFFTLLLSPKVHATHDDNQPKGSIITISGYVICQGERISDVLIDAESTNEETVSDREGKFTINVLKGNVITFQKNGYKTYEYTADGPQERLIICLLSVEETVEAGEEEVKEQHEEKESIIIIHTKKESEKD